MYKKSHNSKVQSNSSRCRTCLIILALLTVGLISLFFTSLIDVQKLEDKIIGSTIKTETSTTPTTKKEKELIRKEPIQSIISDSSSVSRTVDNVDRSNGVISSKVEKQFPLIKQAQNGEIHFIHIPKCGGTTMTTILRQIQCAVDPVQNADCCLNPGFCDWHAHRRCSTIKGCINHFPQRKFIFKDMPTITVVREPVSRLLSAWFYRGHSPNLDFFQVRPLFKEISLGKRPKVRFEEYIEMVEYQNIQTRMLGADSFPYRNISITEEVNRKSLEALDHIDFIGLQEEFEVSVKALIRAMNVNVTVNMIKERDQGNGKIATQKKELKENKRLMDRVKVVNSYDINLYNTAVKKFCSMVSNFPDLLEKVKSNGKVKCD